MKINTKIFTICATLALSSISYSVFAVEHNHGNYTYEPVTIKGTTFECPCDLPNNIVGRQFRLEFSKQEEIQDLIRNKDKIKKAAYIDNNANNNGHNHHGYTYEPVTISGTTFYCPCDLPNSAIYRDFRLEFNKQEEIQDLLKTKGKTSKPRYASIKSIAKEPVVENGLPESGRVFYDMDDIFMQTTNKEEFEDFFKRYVSRKYTCNEVASLNFATPQNGDLKILVGIDGTPSIISRNMNVNSMLGIKVGSATWKFVQVPVRVEGYQFVNNRWIPIGAIKVLSEQTIKDDPRKIYKNAMNDSINYFTSPEDRITRALFENGIKHRSVLDHMTNW